MASKTPAVRSLAADAILDDGVRLDAKGQLPRALNVTFDPVSSITRYANNPRRNEGAVMDVAASLVEFGWQQPIVVDKDRVIVVGDTRYLAALQLQQTHVPVYVAAHLTPAKAKAYRLADNKVGERAEWDFGKLAVEFEGLEELGANMTITGFRDYEMAPIRAAEWQAPASSGGLGGERDGEDEDPDEPGTVHFQPQQFEAVLEAAERCRRQDKQPQLALTDALVRICQRYQPSKK